MGFDARHTICEIVKSKEKYHEFGADTELLYGEEKKQP